MQKSPEEIAARMRAQTERDIARSAEGMAGNVLGQAVEDLLAAGRETDQASLRTWIRAAINAPHPGLPRPWLEAALRRVESSPGTPGDDPA